MRVISRESDDQSLLGLLETFNPSATPQKLGKHNAATVADALASATTSTTPATSPTITELRMTVATVLDGKALPYPTSITPQSYKEEIIGEMRCYVLSAERSALVPTLIMFYGGGFCLNTMEAHKAFMANVAAETPCNIILPDYPLAPEAKAPEIIARTTDFLRELLKNPISFGASEDIVLMGWSSGSNMALTLSMNLQREAQTLFHKISKLVLLSPWIDLSLRISRKGPYQAQQKADVTAAGADLLELMAGGYLPDGAKGDEPEFCPGYRSDEEMLSLPPVTIIAGGSEVLLGDAVFIANQLGGSGTEVRLLVLEGQTHNYVVNHVLSLDGVPVPSLIAHVVTDESIDNLRGEDGLGLIIRNFNERAARSLYRA